MQSNLAPFLYSNFESSNQEKKKQKLNVILKLLFYFFKLVEFYNKKFKKHAYMK